MSRLDEIRELAGWDADVAWLLARIDQTLALHQMRGSVISGIWFCVGCRFATHSANARCPTVRLLSGEDE